MKQLSENWSAEAPEAGIIKRACMSAGISLAVLGMLVMVAWLEHWPALIRIDPAFVPMQFNTALCFFLFGTGIFSVSMRRYGRWVGIGCALAVGIFSVLTGLQYLLAVDFGLDALFVKPWIHIKGGYPGRMAPNTSFCFFFLSLSLLFIHCLRRNAAGLGIVLMPALVVLILGVNGLAGYLFGLEAAYDWWGGGNMAPHTVLGFLVASLAMLVLACITHRGIDGGYGLSWKPAMTASIGIALTFLLGQSILINLQNQAENAARAELTRGALIIRDRLQSDLGALRRMQARWISGDTATLAAWVRDAENYIKDDEDYASFLLIDENLNDVKMVSRKDVNAGRALFHFAGIDALEKRNRFFAVSTPANPSYIIFGFPLARAGAPGGFLLTAYDIGNEERLIQAQETDQSLHFRIMDGSDIVFSSGDWPDYSWKIEQGRRLDFIGRSWTLRQIIDVSGFHNDAFVFLILVSGTGLSLLLAYAMWQNSRVLTFAENLKLSDERYAFALANSKVGTWDWDPETDHAIWGGNAWEIVGAQSNDQLNETHAFVRALIPEADNKALNEEVARALTGGTGFSIPFRLIRLDGREIWVQTTGKAVSSRNGVTTRVAGTLIDITARKHAEDELKRSNQELEQFAYVASHDLKAPLRNIDNLAKWVMEDMGGAMPPDIQEKMELLRGRVSGLETLLEDILSYSRAGRITEDAVDIDVAALVDRITQTHVPDRFEVRVNGILPHIVSPRTPLEQIFGNLLSNAVKHHDREKGVIDIAASLNDGFYEFSVTDDGPGIPEEYHDRVFQMFQTLQSRDRVPGSGLGMAIVKKLVEWQGGRVWIEAAPGGRGTSVHFLWPQKPGPNHVVS